MIRCIRCIIASTIVLHACYLISVAIACIRAPDLESTLRRSPDLESTLWRSPDLESTLVFRSRPTVPRPRVLYPRWIPAHNGYLGNEKADELAKRGSGDIEAQNVTLPVPRTVQRNALRQRTHRKMKERFKDMPPHFRTVWRPSYSKPLSNIYKNKLRAATQYLTGHCELNYHLNKYKPQNITKICPHCSMEEETINHFIGQCPMWFNLLIED